MKISGPWTMEKAEEFLASAVIPLRVSVTDSHGCPVVVSLWYLYDEGAFWCALHQGARLLRLLDREGRCGFEIAGDQPPYRGVRGQGDVRLVTERGPEILDRLLDRYLGGRDSSLAQWLLSRSAEETAVCIVPRRLATWDYSKRMKGISSPSLI